MGKRVREKQSAIHHHGNGSHHTHPGRVWGILHIIKYHHWRHVKRRLTTHRRHGGGRNDASNKSSLFVLLLPSFFLIAIVSYLYASG